MPDHINSCYCCGEPFEASEPDELCPECAEPQRIYWAVPTHYTIGEAFESRADAEVAAQLKANRTGHDAWVDERWVARRLSGGTMDAAVSRTRFTPALPTEPARWIVTAEIPTHAFTLEVMARSELEARIAVKHRVARDYAEYGLTPTDVETTSAEQR